MASRGHVEHDFLGMENPPGNHHSSSARLDRRQSFRCISKIDPEIVKSVMASAAKADNASPPVGVAEFPQLPVYHPFPISRASKIDLDKGKGKEGDRETGPMTIFYNGTVSVFDLPKDVLESIINFAMEKTSSFKENDHKQVDQPIILDSINDGDLPIKRKKSLQRFFEKRKERLVSVTPDMTEQVSTMQLHQRP